MPREVNPPRVYDSPRPAASAGASRSVNMAASSSSAPSARLTSAPADAAGAVPPKKAPSLKKSVRKSNGPKKAGLPPALLQSSLLGASTFTFPVDDDFQSLLSTEPMLAPPRYAARISLAGIDLASSDAGSPPRAYPTPLTPPSSQDHHDDAQAPAARKARDSGFVGSDEAGEADAYHVMLSARASQRSKSQPSPPLASSTGRRAFSHAPQSPLKTSLVRPRKRAPSLLASPNKGADANNPNPKARKQAKPSAATKSLSDHRFTFSTPGAGPSRRTATTAPRTERPAKKSTLSQSVKAAATQRRKSAPVSLPKGVPIRRTAMDPNMPPPPPSPSDDPILLKGAERIRFLEPSPGADEARAAQDRMDAEEEDELDFSAEAPRATEAAPPRLASLDQSSDREIGDVQLDDDYWGGGMDGMEVGGVGFEVSGMASDSDADSGEDADNTFYPQADDARHQELRLSDLDSIRAFVPPVTTSAAELRDTTPLEAPPNPPTPQRASSKSPAARPQPSPSPSPRPRSHSVTPAPASSSPAPRLRSPTATPPAQPVSWRSLSVTPVAQPAVARSPSGTPPAHRNERFVPSETPVARQPIASSPASTPAHSLVGQSSPSRTPLTEPVAQHSLAVGLTPTFQRFAVRSPSSTPTARVAAAALPLAATPEPLEVAVQPPSSTPSPAQQLAVAGTPTAQFGSSQPSASETPLAGHDAIADTPAPALSPYVFGPPRTPESYSGSEPDEESQARHSLVPEPDADHDEPEAPRSEDSFFGEIDRQWEARDQSLDAAGWGARVRSSLSPDSTDDERDEAAISEQEEQGEGDASHSLVAPVQQLGVPQPPASEREENAPDLPVAESPEPEQDAPQVAAAVESALPDEIEILADEQQEQETPQVVVAEMDEPDVPPAPDAEIEAQDATEVPADETAHGHDAGDERDSEEEQLNGDDDGSAASDSDHTHAMTDRGEDGADGSGSDDDDDADSFFGEIEQKSLLEEMEEDQDDPSDVLDITTGAFDFQSVQLEEFRAFVNAVDDPESHDENDAFGPSEAEDAHDNDVTLPAAERQASEPFIDRASQHDLLEAPLPAPSVVDAHDEVDVPLVEDVDVAADVRLIDEDDDQPATDNDVQFESHESLREDEELASATQELHSEADEEDVVIDTAAPDFEEPASSPSLATSDIPVADAPASERLRSPSLVREVADATPETPVDNVAPSTVPMELTPDDSVELNESADDSVSSQSMHDRSPSPARQATLNRSPVHQALPPASASPVRRAPSNPSSSPPIHRTPMRASRSPEPLRTSLAPSSAARAEPAAHVTHGWPGTDSRAVDGDRSLSSAAEPWVKVSSNDPRQAARATAFLKLFHDYVETGADPNASTTSSVRDRSFASRMSSLDTSRRRSSANWAADLSMVSVADDLLMEAEQEIALEEDRSADADMAYEDDEDDEELPIPGSFTRATSTQSLGSLMREREAPPRRAVLVDRPWGPAEWRTLMESLDAVGPAASTDAVIARLMQRTNVEEADLVGEWSRSKLSLRVASIQQRRQNEKARSAAKRRRSHHPQKALLLPNKASSPSFSRRPAAQAASSSRAARRSPGVAGGESSSSSRKTTTLADKVLGFLSSWKRAPPAAVVGAARPRTSTIPEFLTSSPAPRPVVGRRPTPPPTPLVIAPSSPSVGRPSSSSTTSRPAPCSSSATSASHGFVPLRQLSFGGPSTSAVPSEPVAVTSQRQTLPSAPGPSRIPTSSIPIPSSTSRAARAAALPTDLPARPRASRPSVSALVKSFEAARSFDDLHASHGHPHPHHSFRG